jgi:exodeoxyribonuclease V alpha subunit
MSTIAPDPFDVNRARHAPGLLRSFNDAGVLTAADVHVALRVATLGGEDDAQVLLAAALAVRAPRLGHVYVDLATIRDTAAVETDEPVDLAKLPWPEATSWVAAVAESALANTGDETMPRPLRLEGSRLYLDRYWREERRVADDLLAFGELGATGVRSDVLREGLARLFEGDEADDRQRAAAQSAVLRRLTVVAGGPGTGKTTTVARIVALLAEQAQAAGTSAPLVALAAPTGKAAARLEQAVHAEATTIEVDDAVKAQLLALHASTLHRLLGRRPGSRSRFRHHRGQRLPHDVVIVDETSMVSLSLMARLVEAVRPDARLVLVGDPGQLASIEAGAVLGDVVGPAGGGERIGGGAISDSIVVLDRVHRYGAGIARLAEAIRKGDADAVLQVLREAPEGVTWIDADVTDDAAAQGALAPVRERAVTAARAVGDAAREGNAADALHALGAFRLLCAHRRGPEGVATWTDRIESWLSEDTGERWYAGRPLLVTENDYELGLYNGDTGVVVQAAPDRLAAAFERGGEVVELSPSRLGAVDTVYAMTIHKSQGSQFATAAVLLPSPASRILTRELLYTAATRAREQLILAGTEEAIRAAVARPVARASGLRERLESVGRSR